MLTLSFAPGSQVVFFLVCAFQDVAAEMTARWQFLPFGDRSTRRDAVGTSPALCTMDDKSTCFIYFT